MRIRFECNSRKFYVALNINSIHDVGLKSELELGYEFTVEVNLIGRICAIYGHIKGTAGHKVGVGFAALLFAPLVVQPSIFAYHMLSAVICKPRIQVESNGWMWPHHVTVLQIHVE